MHNMAIALSVVSTRIRGDDDGNDGNNAESDVLLPFASASSSTLRLGRLVVETLFGTESFGHTNTIIGKIRPVEGRGVEKTFEQKELVVVPVVAVQLCSIAPVDTNEVAVNFSCHR